MTCTQSIFKGLMLVIAIYSVGISACFGQDRNAEKLGDLYLNIENSMSTRKASKLLPFNYFKLLLPTYYQSKYIDQIFEKILWRDKTKSKNDRFRVLYHVEKNLLLNLYNANGKQEKSLAIYSELESGNKKGSFEFEGSLHDALLSPSGDFSVIVTKDKNSTFFAVIDLNNNKLAYSLKFKHSKLDKKKNQYYITNGHFVLAENSQNDDLKRTMLVYRLDEKSKPVNLGSLLWFFDDPLVFNSQLKGQFLYGIASITMYKWDLKSKKKVKEVKTYKKDYGTFFIDQPGNKNLLMVNKPYNRNDSLVIIERDFDLNLISEYYLGEKKRIEIDELITPDRNMLLEIHQSGIRFNLFRANQEIALEYYKKAGLSDLQINNKLGDYWERKDSLLKAIDFYVLAKNNTAVKKIAAAAFAIRKFDLYIHCKKALGATDTVAIYTEIGDKLALSSYGEALTFYNKAGNRKKAEVMILDLIRQFRKLDFVEKYCKDSTYTEGLNQLAQQYLSKDKVENLGKAVELYTLAGNNQEINKLKSEASQHISQSMTNYEMHFRNMISRIEEFSKIKDWREFNYPVSGLANTVRKINSAINSVVVHSDLVGRKDEKMEYYRELAKKIEKIAKQSNDMANNLDRELANVKKSSSRQLFMLATKYKAGALNYSMEVASMFKDIPQTIQ